MMNVASWIGKKAFQTLLGDSSESTNAGMVSTAVNATSHVATRALDSLVTTFLGKDITKALGNGITTLTDSVGYTFKNIPLAGMSVAIIGAGVKYKKIGLVLSGVAPMTQLLANYMFEKLRVCHENFPPIESCSGYWLNKTCEITMNTTCQSTQLTHDMLNYTTYAAIAIPTIQLLYLSLQKGAKAF